MTEDRLRQIVAGVLGLQPDDIDDSTEFDSHDGMMVCLAVEDEWDRRFEDDQVGMLTSWPAVRDLVLNPRFYKALVLDADGTLWQGILGEGGVIPDARFDEVRHTYAELQQRGVLLCLASKNNVTDLADAPWEPLTADSFAVMEAGWQSKVDSLRMIAGELNIGLDAIVFVDDSTFECEEVRARLPEVHVVQVPELLADYPAVARSVAALFPAMVDTSKTDQYRALAAAEATRKHYVTEKEFLASLDAHVTLRLNDRSEAARIAELTQKANQFNLTTRRYAESDIRNFMDTDNVYSIHYRDRFGDQGIVGVLIRMDAYIDTFLLSCRVIGRNIETQIWEKITDDAKWAGFNTLDAQYIPTSKNAQVRDLWERLGMRMTKEYEGVRTYVGIPRG